MLGKDYLSSLWNPRISGWLHTEVCMYEEDPIKWLVKSFRLKDIYCITVLYTDTWNLYMHVYVFPECTALEKGTGSNKYVAEFRICWVHFKCGSEDVAGAGVHDPSVASSAVSRYAYSETSIRNIYGNKWTEMSLFTYQTNTKSLIILLNQNKFFKVKQTDDALLLPLHFALI